MQECSNHNKNQVFPSINLFTSIMSSARGKSFTPEQDEAICRAYLCITEDPIIGNSQPRSQFWMRVLQEYKEKTNDDQRSETSMKSRWQIIQKCCNKFRGCLRIVEAHHQSGMTTQNEYDMAKQAYYEDTGKHFNGMDGCWQILAQSIKWQDLNHTGKKSKTSEAAQFEDLMSSPFSVEDTQVPSTYESVDAETTPSSGGTGSVSSPRKRPGGTKQAKRNKAKGKEIEESRARHINLLETLNKTLADNQAQKMELEKMKAESLLRSANCEESQMEERIMTTNLFNIEDPRARAYYKARQDAILAKWNSSSSTPAPYFPDLPEF